MSNLVTITNNYDNGVCDGFYIYTGTTYNGNPFTIPPSADLISNQLISLPYTFGVGSYTGPLYVFLEHCDSHVTPPPEDNPKKQGGFQVEFINIECPEPCVADGFDCRMSAIFTEFSDCDMDATFTPYVGTDCDMDATFTPFIDTDCDIAVSFVEFIEPTPSPTSSSTPSPTNTPTPTPTVVCEWEATFVELT
jgi:hypothetical protein